MKIAFATIGIPFDGSSLEKTGLGGSESACIYLARELAKRGHAVTVFCRCRTGTFDGVCYLPIERFAKSGRWDVAVVYRYWELAHPAIDAEVIIGWSQDLPNPLPLLAALWQIDRLAVTTDYHAESYLKAIPEIGPLLFRTGNGVDTQECWEAGHFEERIGPEYETRAVKKDPRKLIYTSRPERGLVWLLSAIFPKLLEKFPDLKLHVATYDFPFELAPEHQAAHALCNALIEKLGDSVVKLGSLSKSELYREMATAAALVYPCDYAGETSCMTVLEAQACGLWVVTTNDYALRETAAGPGCIRIAGHPSREMYQATFIEAVENILEGVHGDPPAAKVPTWGEIAEQWESVLEGEVLDRHRPLLAKARKTTTIACCMIVKNEAANLARCLASVRPFVDKLHILDTGSTDQTMEVARQFRPDSLVNVPFTDFADMRNESKFPASSDWILWIDADEVLIGGENLRKYTRTRFHEGYAIQQVQVHMQDKTGKTVADTPIRLFRNRLDYKFVGIIHEHCLAGDTLIDLPGERVMIKDLVGRSDFWLWSYSHGDGKVVLRKADRVWKVGFQQTIEVILDDGFFRCTPEHLVMLRNGSYKQADQLRAGDSLMPFYRSMLTKRSGRKMIDEWHVVLNNEMTAREHRYIWEQIHGPIAPGNQIHHKDRCHTNNLPGNLESLTHSDHSRLTLSEWNKRDRVGAAPLGTLGIKVEGKRIGTRRAIPRKKCGR